MRTFIVWGVTSAGAAVAYAFVSFFLLVPALRDQPLSLLYYGFQGLIFGLAYAGLSALQRWVAGRGGFSITVNTLCGGVSGLLSMSYNVVITLYTAFGRSDHIVSDEVKQSIVLRLCEFSAGSMIIGVLVGLLVGLWKTRPQQSNG